LYVGDMSSNGAKMRILYYKQCLDKSCGIRKNCRFSITILENAVKININNKYYNEGGAIIM